MNDLEKLSADFYTGLQALKGPAAQKTAIAIYSTFFGRIIDISWDDPSAEIFFILDNDVRISIS